MPNGPQPECRLLGGPPAWLAQGLLGLAALAGLLIKRCCPFPFLPCPCPPLLVAHDHLIMIADHRRHKEVPRRPLDVWGFDLAKQVLSMLVAHICGAFIPAQPGAAAKPGR